MPGRGDGVSGRRDLVPDRGDEVSVHHDEVSGRGNKVSRRRDQVSVGQYALPCLGNEVSSAANALSGG